MTTTNDIESTPPLSQPDIIATGDNWYRGKMMLLSLALILYCGGYFLYDGFIGYPKNNQKIDALTAQIDATNDHDEKSKLITERDKLGVRKSSTDLLTQKWIGFISLPVGFWVMFNSLRKSRGQIRLAGQTLHAPGHPPIPFESITAVDQRLWDKKGIARIEYSLPEGKNGKLTLDDYIYQRRPIDQIFDAIIGYVAPTGETGKTLDQ